MKHRHTYTRKIKAPGNMQMSHGVLFIKRCVTCGLVFREHFYKKGKPPEVNYERSGKVYLELPECINWDAEDETIDLTWQHKKRTTAGQRRSLCF